MEDNATASIFEDLRRCPVTVTAIAEAYHMERSGGNSSTKMRVDHTEREDFQYAYWKDISGSVANLEDHAAVAVEVVATYECADTNTTESRTALTERLLEACRKACPGKLVRSYERVCIEHASYEVDRRRTFVTRSPGVEHPAWMATSYYTKCRFAFPLLGTIYRILFFRSMTHVRYNLIKQVTISGRGVPGSGWSRR